MRKGGANDVCVLHTSRVWGNAAPGWGKILIRIEDRNGKSSGTRAGRGGVDFLRGGLIELKVEYRGGGDGREGKGVGVAHIG